MQSRKAGATGLSGPARCPVETSSHGARCESTLSETRGATPSQVPRSHELNSSPRGPMHQPPDDPFGWPPAEKAGEPTPGSHSPRAEPAHDPFMRPVPPDEPAMSNAARPAADHPPSPEPAARPPEPPPAPQAPAPGRTLSAPTPPIAPMPASRQLPAGRRVDVIGLVNRVLDTLDTVGDRIAAIAGIRPPNR